MFDLFFVRVFFLLVGTIFSAWTDLKKGIILDQVTVPMIVVGTVFNLMQMDFNAVFFSGIVFAVGFFLYFSGKIGGGDVKLFTGIAAMLPDFGGHFFLLNVVIVSGLSGMVFISVFYCLKYLRLEKSFSVVFAENKESLKKSFLLGIAVAGYFFVVFSTGLIELIHVFVFGLPMCFGLVFLGLEKGIRKKVFLQNISVKELEEDEIIALEFAGQTISDLFGLGLKGVIDKKTIQLFQANNISSVPVYRNLPKFAPFILIGVIVSLFFNDVFLLA